MCVRRRVSCNEIRNRRGVINFRFVLDPDWCPYDRSLAGGPRITPAAQPYHGISVWPSRQRTRATRRRRWVRKRTPDSQGGRPDGLGAPRRQAQRALGAALLPHPRRDRGPGRLRAASSPRSVGVVRGHAHVLRHAGHQQHLPAHHVRHAHGFRRRNPRARLRASSSAPSAKASSAPWCTSTSSPSNPRTSTRSDGPS